MDKNAFLETVKAAQAKAKTKLLPAFGLADVVSNPRTVGTPKEAFMRNFKATGGKVLESAQELAKFLEEHGCKCGIIDEKLEDSFGLDYKFKILRAFDKSSPDEADFALSKASMAIAEGGMLVLKDKDTSDRLNTIAPWIHVAVLDAADIVPTLFDGLLQTADNPYSIYVAGPSKTADVEGILIEGVHGPGVQACYII